MSDVPLDQWIKEKYKIKMTDRFGLEQWQLARLNDMLAYVKERSFYYANTLQGINQISDLDQIVQIPFTDAGILKKQGTKMLCVSQGEVSRVVTLDTSGTTNLPKRIFFTEADQELTVDFFHHGMSILARAGEKAFIALPCASEGSVGDLLAKGLERLHVSSIRFGMVKELALAAKVLEEKQPQVCIGVPVQMLILAEYCSRHGISTGVQRILLSTDYASHALVQRLEALWNCEVFNHYGMTEMGLGGAVECSAHDGMHVRENDLYMEVVDPKTGQLLPDGRQGELVFTTLTRKAMPLIRYRTGDQGMLTTCRCSCGSILKKVMYVGDRLSQLQIQRIDEAMFAIPGIMDYSLTLKSSVLCIKIYHMETKSMSYTELKQQVRKLSVWQEVLGDVTDCIWEICIEEIEECMPLYQGKRRIYSDIV